MKGPYVHLRDVKLGDESWVHYAAIVSMRKVGDSQTTTVVYRAGNGTLAAFDNESSPEQIMERIEEARRRELKTFDEAFE
jgi:hypothetical protein